DFGIRCHPIGERPALEPHVPHTALASGARAGEEGKRNLAVKTKLNTAVPVEVEASVQAKKPKETTPEFIASIAAVLVTGLFIITFTLQAFVIPSSSMENTLLIGDHVFVDRMMLAPKANWIGPLIP